MKNATEEQAVQYWFRSRRGADVETTVERIVTDVRRRGLAAVEKWTRDLDGSERISVRISSREMDGAAKAVSPDLRGALGRARRRIERFARAQRTSLRPFSLRGNGELLEQRLVPVDCAGAYVPGGRFPLLSTALMTVIPAKVAGVKRVVVCTPPDADGSVAPEILYAAAEAGADAVFAVGGAQAVAALAFGAGPIPAVDVLVGPGNRYVAAAKRLVSRRVRIDAVAGPSELLVIADGGADAAMIAREMLAQAEHDPDARVVLLSTSTAISKKVEKAIAESVHRGLARRIGKAPVVKVPSLSAAVILANRLAPEHLSVQTRKPERLAGRLTNCGALFLGPYAKVALGDYIAGPNHTLPTGGTARGRGGLSVFDFLKVQTVESFDRRAAARLGGDAAILADAEGLRAHAESVS